MCLPSLPGPYLIVFLLPRLHHNLLALAPLVTVFPAQPSPHPLTLVLVVTDVVTAGDHHSAGNFPERCCRDCSDQSKGEGTVVAWGVITLLLSTYTPLVPSG